MVNHPTKNKKTMPKECDMVFIGDLCIIKKNTKHKRVSF